MAGTRAYDYRNQMVEFADTLNGQVHTYAYDCFGRLIRKVVDSTGTPAETRYVSCGGRVVE